MESDEAIPTTTTTTVVDHSPHQGDLDTFLTLICGHTKLERDRGMARLTEVFTSASTKDEHFRYFESKLSTFITSLSLEHLEDWETEHGHLLAAKLFVATVVSDKISFQFRELFRNFALKNLAHGELRVRQQSGESIGALCQKFGVDIYKQCQHEIFTGIKENLKRGLEDGTNEDPSDNDDKSNEENTFHDKTQIFHDTAGWKCLETSMNCLKHVVTSCGSSFLPFVSEDFLELLMKTLKHINRFVRETSYYVCASLVSCGRVGDCAVDSGHPARVHSKLFSSCFTDGLSDNWSQVRMAASVGTREFIISVKVPEHLYFNQLIPRMCLNRYYVAEGVRLYSQRTWSMVSQGHGKEIVEQYIGDVVMFYLDETTADNHAVREAACACIAELASKVCKDAVRSHVHSMLAALLVCFKDDSWPVRDAACVACGSFVLGFPAESRSTMDQLYPMFFGNLGDPIASVRQGAALALSNVIKAYGEEADKVVIDKVVEGLKGIENQSSSSDKYGVDDVGLAQFGVVKMKRDNDSASHTDQPMYSCGSLAPKMRGGGCMDHQFHRASEPWEICDGCISLVTELSANPTVVSHISKLLPLVGDACRKQHYIQHINIATTVCKCLPTIAKSLGKKMFKNYIEIFLDPIFYCLTCDNLLAVTAAEDCLMSLAQFIGVGILSGRVENHNPSYLPQMKNCLSNLM